MPIFELQWAYSSVLYLLPLAILPWISKGTEKTIVWSPFIPVDPLSDLIGVLLKSIASILITFLILVLAKPYYPEQTVQRFGSGAEIVILVDRSRSMDDPLISSKKAVGASRTVGKENSKRRVANKYLLEFINKRPDDRFGFILFSNKALELLSFTNNHDSVRAVVKASSLGKGLSETNIAQALIKAADMYSNEDYHGSRAVLLISDGGQELSTNEKALIRELFQREKITLYWLYVGAIEGLTANKTVKDLPMTPDKKLHDFFETLSTPYIGFDIQSIKTFSDTLETINKQQKEALIVDEIIPRKPMETPFLWVAFIASLILLLTNVITVWGVRKAKH